MKRLRIWYWTVAMDYWDRQTERAEKRRNKSFDKWETAWDRRLALRKGK